MKNLITSAFLLLALLLPGTAAACDFEVDGIYYVINGNQATVTSGTVKYTGDVTIPATVTNGDSIYSVTAIGDKAFSYCYGLKSVNIPESITTLGTEAFSCCYNLKSVTIPNSVTAIGWYAFTNCNELNDVYSYITDPQSVDVGNAVFKKYNDDYSGCTLHVPYGTVNAYQVNEHWSPYFEQIVELDPEMELIGDVNFDGKVDIADINAIMDIILGIDVYASEADVNRDGEVTIADINAIMDIIMSANEGLEPEPEHE